MKEEYVIPRTSDTVPATQLCSSMLTTFYVAHGAIVSIEDADDETINFFIHFANDAFHNLMFAERHWKCFNKQISNLLSFACKLYDACGDEVDQKTADALTDIQCELFEYLNNN